MHYKGQVGTFLVAEANNKQHKLLVGTWNHRKECLQYNNCSISKFNHKITKLNKFYKLENPKLTTDYED